MMNRHRCLFTTYVLKTVLKFWAACRDAPNIEIHAIRADKMHISQLKSETGNEANEFACMLLLRPPPRELLEAGPPASVRQALERFEQRVDEGTKAAEQLAADLGIPLPQ